MSGDAAAAAPGARIVVGRVGRVPRRRSRGEAEKEKASAVSSQAPRAAIVLALAISIERAIERAELRDFADAARRLGLSRARLTQIGDLLLLAPWIQELVLAGGTRCSERDLRRIGGESCWSKQALAVAAFEGKTPDPRNVFHFL